MRPLVPKGTGRGVLRWSQTNSQLLYFRNLLSISRTYIQIILGSHAFMAEELSVACQF